MAAGKGWHDRVRVNWLFSTADLISRRTMAYDIQQSDAAWASWLCDGPCKSLGRHHRLSRVASGWVPSPISNGEPDEDALSDATDDDCVSQREFDACEACCSPRPLSLQAEVDAEARKWSTEWACDGPPGDIQWPSDWKDRAPLPQLAAAALQTAARPDGGRRLIGLLPSVIRWWMRARLDVVRAWRPPHDRPFFYAGLWRGAEVDAWKQAARAEPAHCLYFLSHANAMLDAAKAFERVSHHWLAKQGARHSYPTAVLRLSNAAYRLARCITIGGVCSVLLLATGGIATGAVRATIELRLLLVEWLDETVALHRCIVITVYVDDTSFDASGSDWMVCDTVVGTVRHFTERIVEIGMEVSPRKNMVLASRQELAYRIVDQLPGLRLKVVDNAKSLGGAACFGRVRHAALLATRLWAFKVREPQFQKLRRCGTAALVHGQANAGVSNTMLQSRSVAVAAASVPGGGGELDIALILADGGMGGEADLAFAAHEASIANWAEAAWEGHGLFVQDIFKHLNGRDGDNWGASEKSASRSIFANRQWPQARSCVRAGLCDPQADDPRFTGHLAQRVLARPATEPRRQKTAPAWIQELPRQHTDPEGTLALSPADLAMLTRGIAPYPASALDPPPEQESFEWVVRPGPLAAQVDAYVEGSRLDGEADLHDLCARQGWAIAACDGNGELVAAAHGRTPPWAVGIQATEMWGLLMAVQSFDPASSLKVDCSAVQLGTKRGARWATAPCRTLARAWGPISAALESDPDRVAWLPANRCPLDTLTPLDPGANRQYVRDSEAERPRRTRGCKRKAAPAGDACELGDEAAKACPPPAAPSAAWDSAGGALGRPAAAAAPAATVWRKERAKKKKKANEAAPAADPMAALRARIAAKEESAEAAAPSPGCHT
ncbi:unnamed protein product [Prorocentrum cordatum]|uniref:Reverse transcriptase domain-containing protein n=1 Tax=Prorocentrum cordatum TaxID=2364126 RepID=A0ABN9U659_9DINO|nr:unnamed protein product [Polarella glacialis]